LLMRRLIMCSLLSFRGTVVVATPRFPILSFLRFVAYGGVLRGSMGREGPKRDLPQQPSAPFAHRILDSFHPHFARNYTVLSYRGRDASIEYRFVAQGEFFRSTSALVIRPKPALLVTFFSGR